MNSKELRSQVRALPPINSPNTPFWNAKREAFREQMLGGNLENFLNWPVSTQTISSNAHLFTKQELSMMPPHYKSATYDTLVGNPNPYGHSSGSYIGAAYNFYILERETGYSIADMESVVEFGGGFGAMPAVARNLGFRGTWYMYDYPELLLLQEWYLSRCKVRNVEFIGEIDNLPEECDFFVAIHSLNEAPRDTQERFINHVKPRSFLVIGPSKKKPMLPDLEYNSFVMFKRRRYYVA